jgi:hypothetical protein
VDAEGRKFGTNTWKRPSVSPQSANSGELNIAYRIHIDALARESMKRP